MVPQSTLVLSTHYRRILFMKSSFWLLAAVLLVPGCASRYNITLNSGNTITTRGKPKYDAITSSYQFKDSNGRPGSLLAFRVKEIAPQ